MLITEASSCPTGSCKKPTTCQTCNNIETCQWCESSGGSASDGACQDYQSSCDAPNTVVLWPGECPSADSQCTSYHSCNGCVDNGCQYCSSSGCQAASANCHGTAYVSPGTCPSSLVCDTFQDCSACTTDDNCAWCPSACVAVADVGATCPATNASVWPDQCPGAVAVDDDALSSCESYDTCEACWNDAACQYCSYRGCQLQGSFCVAEAVHSRETTRCPVGDCYTLGCFECMEHGEVPADDDTVGNWNAYKWADDAPSHQCYWCNDRCVFGSDFCPSNVAWYKHNTVVACGSEPPLQAIEVVTFSFTIVLLFAVAARLCNPCSRYRLYRTWQVLAAVVTTLSAVTWDKSSARHGWKWVLIPLAAVAFFLGTVGIVRERRKATRRAEQLASQAAAFEPLGRGISTAAAVFAPAADEYLSAPLAEIEAHGASTAGHATGNYGDYAPLADNELPPAAASAYETSPRNLPPTTAASTFVGL